MVVRCTAALNTAWLDGDMTITTIKGEEPRGTGGFYVGDGDMVLVAEPKKGRRIPVASGTQLAKVLRLTQGNGAFTLATIASLTGASEAAASARLRDLRANGYIVTCTKPKGDKQRVYTVETAAVAA